MASVAQNEGPPDPGCVPVRQLRVVVGAAALMVLDFADRHVVVATFPRLQAEWGASDTQLGEYVSVVSVLGPAEDDVRAFWTSVVNAIAPIVGDSSAAGRHRIVVDEDVDQLPGQIAARLGENGTPIVLVLGNLHESTSLAVHQSLLRLVQRPPEGLRCVATTRRDPLRPLQIPPVGFTPRRCPPSSGQLRPVSVRRIRSVRGLPPRTSSPTVHS
jgi:hypothetical protein